MLVRITRFRRRGRGRGGGGGDATYLGFGYKVLVGFKGSRVQFGLRVQGLAGCSVGGLRVSGASSQDSPPESTPQPSHRKTSKPQKPQPGF